MTKHPTEMLRAAITRRQVMTGAAGLTFAIALSRGDPAAAEFHSADSRGAAVPRRT